MSYWDTPTYYSEPTVIYTQPTTVVESPTYYSQPAATDHVDSGTTYVDTQNYPAPSVEAPGKMYENQYAAPSVPAAPPTSGIPQNNNTAPPPAQQAPQQQTQAKEPDQRVIAAVTKGNEHFGAGRYAEASKAYGEAVAIDGADGIARLLYGLSSFATGDFVSASASTRQAMQTTPDLIYYPFNVKALYRDPVKFEEQISALTRHVDAQPGDREAQFLLGYLSYASGDAQKANTTFTVLATSYPDESLYLNLRDASNEALKSLSRQQSPQQQTQAQPTP